MTRSFFKTCETSVFEAPKKTEVWFCYHFFQYSTGPCTDTTCWPAKVTSQWYYGRPTVTRLEAYGNPLDCSGIVNMMLGWQGNPDSLRLRPRFFVSCFPLKGEDVQTSKIYYCIVYNIVFNFVLNICIYLCTWHVHISSFYLMFFNTEDDFARRKSHYWWAPWRP